MRRASGLLILALFLVMPSGAKAAGVPQVGASWVTEVTASSAILHAEVNPEGLATTYRFQYLPESAYDSNIAAAREGFAGATSVPSAGGSAGQGTTPQNVLGLLSGLPPSTAYRWRVLVENGAGPAQGPTLRLETEETAPVFALPDGRAWEMVSPVDKDGGTIEAPGQILGGGQLQAAAQGGAISYSSSSSFGSPGGAPAASQYLSTRGTGSWSTTNITAPQSSEAEPRGGSGVPYRALSFDLDEGLVYGGGSCRAPGEGCADPSPPLPGSGAPAGYQDYYLRDSDAGTFRALLTIADAPSLSIPAEAFELDLAGATPDLAHAILSTCARLTPDATEVPARGAGCVGAEANLYAWGDGQLRLVNLLPGEAHGTPGATLAAPNGAISADGSRVYFTESEDGALYLGEAGAPTRLVPETIGGGASFQAASADGSVAFFIKGGELYRYGAAGEASEPLAAGVEGVLGASADGSVVYFQSTSGLYRWSEGTLTEIAPGAAVAEPGDRPPATGSARVSSDGSVLVFTSKAAPTGVDDTDAATGTPDSELYVYEAGPRLLTCASCDPTGERPVGPSSMRGAVFNGEGAIGTSLYKPRALAAGGTRLFFDSEDHLVLQDTNSRPDVYEWEAPGVGSCTRPSAVDSGCVSLISSGRDGEASEFIDASESGGDVFFRTAASLVASDPGSYDLYDAREGGGFPVPATPIPCDGDACQPLPSPPEDPAPGTLVQSPGNPPPKVLDGGGGKHHSHKKKRHHHRKGGAHHHRRKKASHRDKAGGGR